MPSITKTDITDTFNQIFSSTKTYKQLSEYDKLCSLLALTANTSSGEGTGIVSIKDKTVSTNLLAIDTNGLIGINNLSILGNKLDSILTELDSKASLSDTQPVSLSTGTNVIGNIGNTSFASTQSGTWNIGSITTLPSLPTGTNTIGSIANTTFASTQSGTWNITNVSGTVSLPTNASTSTNQTTGNTSLASIDAKLTSGVNTTVSNLVPTVGVSGSKNVTTASTFEVLLASTVLASGIYIQSKTTNTGLVTVRYLGTTDGVVLEKGQSLFFAINNTNKLEVAVSVNGEGLRWWGS